MEFFRYQISDHIYHSHVHFLSAKSHRYDKIGGLKVSRKVNAVATFA